MGPALSRAPGASENNRRGGVVRLVLRFCLAGVIAAGATLAVAWIWTAIGGGEMSLHGWIALSLGVMGTCGLGWALMALAFHSDRAGWDDGVDNTLDPGRRGED